MLNIGTWQEAVFGLVMATIFIFLRYSFFSGLAFYFFYHRNSDRLKKYRIQEKFPRKQDYRREFLYSMSTIAIFAATGIGVGMLVHLGYTSIYFEVAEYGWGYFFFSILILILAHDAYFYLCHRLMHTRLLYKHVHRVHHLSTNPSPWAAFSFHPFEAVIETAIFPIMAFLMPVHPLALLIFASFSLAMNVMGHLGYELFPPGFTRSIFWWQNTSTHHNLHHRKFNCNYGLYFNWWDRIFKTNYLNYHEEFEKIAGTARKQKTVKPSEKVVFQ